MVIIVIYSTYFLRIVLFCFAVSSQISSSSVCLADYCPIFGCCAGKQHSNKIDNSYGSRTKTAFHNIVSCTAVEVEKSRYKCETLANNCFLDENDRQRFISKICGGLRCEHGILKGYTPPTDNREVNSDGALVVVILKAVFIAIILLFVVFYGFSTGVFSSFLRKNRSSRKLRKGE